MVQQFIIMVHVVGINGTLNAQACLCRVSPCWGVQGAARGVLQPIGSVGASKHKVAIAGLLELAVLYTSTKKLRSLGSSGWRVGRAPPADWPNLG